MRASTGQPHTGELTLLGQKIDGLDGLRCLAVSAVIGTHLGDYQWFIDHDIAQYHVLVGGSTGVLLFFVLSGFLITTRELQKLKRRGSFSIRDFFISRALRIFPLYYFALLCYLFVYALGIHDLNATSMVFAVTYLYNFIPAGHYQSWLGSFHTLATEQHFYVIFPLLFAWAVRKRTIFVFATTLAAYVAIASILRPHLEFLGKGYVEGIHRWTFFAAIPILVGSILACVRESAAYARFRHSLTDSPIRGILFSISAAAVFLAGYLSQILKSNDLTLSLGFAALILLVAERPNALLTKLLGLQPLDYLGKISYGLYVWQSFILSTGPADALVTNAPLAIAAIVALSVFSYHAFEARLLKLKDRLRNRGANLSAVSAR